MALGTEISYNIIFPPQEQESRQGKATQPQQEGQIDTQDPAKKKSGVGQMAEMAVFAHIGKQMVNFATSNVQTFTGSSRAQDLVNAGMSAIGTAIAFKVNPVLGAVNLALKLVTESITRMENIRRENIRYNQAQLRAGPHFNRSRLEGLGN